MPRRNIYPRSKKIMVLQPERRKWKKVVRRRQFALQRKETMCVILVYKQKNLLYLCTFDLKILPKNDFL